MIDTANFVIENLKGKLTLENISSLSKVNGIGTWTIKTSSLLFSIYNQHIVPDVLIIEDLNVNRWIKNVDKNLYSDLHKGWLSYFLMNGSIKIRS